MRNLRPDVAGQGPGPAEVCPDREDTPTPSRPGPDDEVELVNFERIRQGNETASHIAVPDGWGSSLCGVRAGNHAGFATAVDCPACAQLWRATAKIDEDDIAERLRYR